MEHLLESGVMGSPEEALATLLEAFSSMVFDPELVKEGKSVVRLLGLSRRASPWCACMSHLNFVHVVVDKVRPLVEGACRLATGRRML